MNRMMTQKLISVLLIALSCHLSNAQSDDPFLISSGGGIAQSGSLFLTYSLGEPCISYTLSDLHWVTEGFQQPGNINLTSIDVHTPLEYAYRIFPNPAVRELHIESTDPTPWHQVQITNILGQRMLTESRIVEQTTVVDLNQLRPGIYFLNILDHSTRTITQPFIKL